MASDHLVNHHDRQADEHIRQLCRRVGSAESDEDFQAALQQLRDEIDGSMTRARERLNGLAVVDAYENQSKAAD